MDNAHIWKNFEQFYLNYCSGYWSSGRIDLPYGSFLPLHPDDGASMLYAADLTKEDPANILKDVKALGERHAVPIGFYMTPSWKGDIQAFQDFLLYNGYHESHRMIPHILDDLSVADKIEESAFDIEMTNDPEIVASLYRETFKGDIGISEIITKRMTSTEDHAIKTVFFLARTKEGNIAGMACCNYDETFAYMNCLAVREPYRRQGLASHLVKTRLNHLRDNGVRYAVTIVGWKNTPSLNTQAKIGYKKLIEASIWKPKAVS